MCSALVADSTVLKFGGESHIDLTRNVLLLLFRDKSKTQSGEIGSLAEEFCGTVHALRSECMESADWSELPSLCGKSVYLCGDYFSPNPSLWERVREAKRVLVLQELSSGYEDIWKACAFPGLRLIDAGQVPVLVHDVGILFRRYFDKDTDHFHRISAEHVFQRLTESTKPGTAHRTGIYLTPVQKLGEDYHFHLLRCSSNLSGPTGNFGSNDERIVSALNEEANSLFVNHSPLNHVLAQIYHNSPTSGSKKQTKAKIKAHSDKTKDMPNNSIMAFCSFYDGIERSNCLEDPYDHGYKGRLSALTKLHFSLKKQLAEQPDCTLTREFCVTLYPNSVFFMPISTNRLYTHEIKPAGVDVHMMPTRMGYVVRCSATEAVHRKDETFLKKGNELIKLEPPTAEGMAHLRELYTMENTTDRRVDYGLFKFSMNSGDYLRPIMKEDFIWSEFTTRRNLFEELQAGVVFGDVTKGRRGQVLVLPDATGEIPIVRTTTKYHDPAQYFLPAHHQLAEQIKGIASIPIAFNNALIENYSNSYTTMNFHSDQALDLQEQSYIAVFSCYKYPYVAKTMRKLVIESKDCADEKFKIPLLHNSVVVFSLATNRRYRHKIVLDTTNDAPPNEWLGITFRTSKTIVKFKSDLAYIGDQRLLLASEDQAREFYQLRRKENEKIDFSYPELHFTISPSDVLPPVNLACGVEKSMPVERTTSDENENMMITVKV